MYVVLVNKYGTAALGDASVFGLFDDSDEALGLVETLRTEQPGWEVEMEPVQSPATARQVSP